MNKEEAMKILKDFHDKSALFSVRTALDTIIHELRESEDEKVRKAIIKLVKQSSEILDKQNQNNMITWLEKQKEPKLSEDLREYITELSKQFPEVSFAKLSRIAVRVKNLLEKQGEMSKMCPTSVQDEQQPIDKVEPKFKVGDWITNGDYTWKVIKVEQFDYILQSQNGNIVDDTISHVDEQFHSFTVKDAKDGDVLCTYECGTPKIVFILKGTPKKHYALGYHCYYNIMYPHFGPDSEKGCLAPNDEDVKPATKEQRDTLERAITNAGYTFNFEKKELKKIKQKPQRMVSAEAKEALYDKPTDEEMKELLRTEYEKGRADAIAEMEKDWSEEDDVMINKLLAVVKLYYDRSGDDLDKQSCISFLKSLKDKVQPQPKQEWSEEDEIARKALINLVEMYYGGCIDKTEKKRLLNLLKSLRPQKQWKPTKGMLDALRLMQAEWHLETPETSENLRYLYQELKQIYYDGN